MFTLVRYIAKNISQVGLKRAQAIVIPEIVLALILVCKNICIY